MRRVFLLLAQVPETAHDAQRQPQKVQKPCAGGYMVATRTKKEKWRYRFDSVLSFAVLVLERVIEPSTNGLRIRLE